MRAHHLARGVRDARGVGGGVLKHRRCVNHVLLLAGVKGVEKDKHTDGQSPAVLLP